MRLLPADAVLRVELLQLGVALLARRPMRSAEILAVFGLGSVDLRHRRLCPIDVRLRPRGADELEVSVGTHRGAADRALEAGSAVRDALEHAARHASEADSFVIRVHLESLEKERSAVADQICWERLLESMHRVPVHLVRCVAAETTAPACETIDTVAFVASPVQGSTRGPSFAQRERAEVVRAWAERVVADGTLSADLVHLHMHGVGGRIRGGPPPDVHAGVLVTSACDAAQADGMVVDAVRSGAVVDAFGFDGQLSLADARMVTRALHEELCMWSMDRAVGVMFAGLAVRRRLVGRDIFTRWRHYRGVSPPSGDAPAGTSNPPRAGVLHDSICPPW